MARPRRAEFHPQLAEFRQRAGLTQEQVAEHVGINAEMVRRHEHGQNMPIPLYRKRYCQLFQATEQDLGFRPIALPVQPIISGGAGAETASAYVSPVAPVHIPAFEFGNADYLQSV